jgi:phospholipase C
MALNDIETIVFVMMENRSFDHMLGYLSLDKTPNKLPVDGLRSDPKWQASYANLAGGKSYPLIRLAPGDSIDEDPPHGRDRIHAQIGTAPAGPGPTLMGGFAATFLEAHPGSPQAGRVMGHYDSAGVPTYDFFARNYCVCDRWFASLPLGTQANRLMSMSGESKIVENAVPIPDQRLVYDWLEENKISWRVYVSGGFAPFFLLMRHWSLRIVQSLALGTGHFRRFNALRSDWKSKKPAPSVIFVEPEYGDAPGSKPNDDHPPAPARRGQDFLNEVYQILTSNPARWAKTLMIVTYDEHGGFFDHVPPLHIAGTAGGESFQTSGIRVPAFLISPHVDAGQVFSEPVDHTSFLALLDQRFGNGSGFSPAVKARQSSLGRLSDALRSKARSGPVPTLPAPVQVKGMGLAAAAARPPSAPDTPNAAALDAMARQLREEHPELFEQPGLSEMKRYLDTNPPPIPKSRDHI